jgi:hypothetical protein
VALATAPYPYSGVAKRLSTSPTSQLMKTVQEGVRKLPDIGKSNLKNRR